MVAVEQEILPQQHQVKAMPGEACVAMLTTTLKALEVAAQVEQVEQDTITAPVDAVDLGRHHR
jgi:hypothetical protein